MRLEEVRTINYKKANAGYYDAPVPEGRMRTEEQRRFVSAEMVKAPDYDRRQLKPVQNPKPTSSGIRIVPMAKAAVINPFDTDDDKNIEYDETKNPFADADEDDADDDESSKSDVAKETSNTDKQTKNPFGEYDNNLNPFE